MKYIWEHLNHHLWRSDSLEMLLTSFWLDSGKTKISIIFIIFCTFLWQFSCPVQVFLLFNWPEIRAYESSNVSLNYLLALFQIMKYIYQKLMSKVAKSRTSAGTSKSAEGYPRDKCKGECFALCTRIYLKILCFLLNYAVFCGIFWISESWHAQAKLPSTPTKSQKS